ncbi:hypothetical protein QNM99_15030 [Pseudomonas sp. PCH446]
MIEELPEEIPQEPPEVLPDELPPEPAEERANAATPPLIGYLVANDSWSDFLIRAHEGDFQRVFGHLWAFDKRPEDSEYRHLWRTRLNQFQYNRRRSVWLTHWTVKALAKRACQRSGVPEQPLADGCSGRRYRILKALFVPTLLLSRRCCARVTWRRRHLSEA